MHRVKPIEFALKRLLQEAPQMFLPLDVQTSQECYLANELTRIRCSKLEPLAKGSCEC